MELVGSCSCFRPPMAHPPPRLSWSKELDARLVRAIHAELEQAAEPSSVAPSASSSSAAAGAATNAEVWRISSPLDWYDVWCRVKSADDDPWPDQLTHKELKKRWDETLRRWFNKSLPAAERSGKRASEVHLGRLLELIEKRDYNVESRPGPKRRTREHSKSVEGEHSKSEDSEDEEEPSAEKKRKASSDPVDSRLEGCLSVMRTAAFQRNFRLHVQHSRSTNASVVLDPQVILDLADGRLPLQRDTFVSLARALLPRGDDNDDGDYVYEFSEQDAIRRHMTSARSFVLLSPAAGVFLGEERVLIVAVVFPAGGGQGCFYSVHWTPASRTDASTADKQLDTDPRTLSGLPAGLFSPLQLKVLPFDGKSHTTDVHLLALYLVSNLLAADSDSTDSNAHSNDHNNHNLVWPGADVARTRILSKLFLSPEPALNIRFALPIEPLQLPHKSLLACLEACGFQQPTWVPSMSRCSRVDLLSGVRHFTKTEVLFVPLDNSRPTVNLSFRREAEAKQLLLVAERGAHGGQSSTFGGLLRIVFGAANATLSLLANKSSVTEMSVRDVDAGVVTRLDMQSPAYTITLPRGTVIAVRVNDVHVSVTIE